MSQAQIDEIRETQAKQREDKKVRKLQNHSPETIFAAYERG